ncbi:succinylglutamate desuccinylase/aspartoacylase family protein [Halosolutus amylolyticus]|uniref:Succinylglutamate desuccinylase/aspartoacylase family protein n=2 Tax=Halosolutus amylolyticus TaxID=2932267 RepID=A0ABD5PP24_9EURY|nr:succinylglutamate desuccinylase/aspartoacylase family protein [Halosolutus amylolyticus]
MKSAGTLSVLASATTVGIPNAPSESPLTRETSSTSRPDDSLRDVLSQLGPRRTLMADTRYESGVYVVEGRSSTGTDPTAVVVAGQHGIEPAGWLTAMQLTGLTLETGRLVVIPFANPPAIVQGRYQTSDGNMNRQFPPGEAPTLDAAAAIWREIRRHEPDVMLDLHSSHGIYASGVNSGVGQVVFPTAAGRDTAVSATKWVNDEFVSPSTYGPEYEFAIGTVQGKEDRPLLTHKVGHDLDVPGYLVEVTREGTTLSDRLAWQTAMATKLLAEHGVTPATA